jgi:hypothetical protein
MIEVYGLYCSGSRWGPVEGCCAHGNEPSGAVKHLWLLFSGCSLFSKRAASVKGAALYAVTPRSSEKSRIFGKINCLHHQCWGVNQARKQRESKGKPNFFELHGADNAPSTCNSWRVFFFGMWHRGKWYNFTNIPLKRTAFISIHLLNVACWATVSFWTWDLWFSTWGMLTPRGTRKHVTSIKTKNRNRLNLEPVLILALTKIRPRIEVLACQKQAQSSH